MLEVSANFEELLNDALAAVRQCDWAAAGRQARALRAHFPDRPEGFLLGATALGGMDDLTAAEALLRKALRKFPANPAVAIEYAWLAHRRQDWAEAERRWEGICKSFPDQPTGTINLGLVARARGDYDKADALLSAAKGRFPDNANAMIAYAWNAVARRDFVEARQRWQDVRARFPDEPLGYLGGALTERESNTLDAAEELLAVGQQRFPDDRSIAVERAWIVSRRRDWPAALARWQELARRFPDDATIATGLDRAQKEVSQASRASESQPGGPGDGFAWNRQPLTLLSGDSPAGIERDVLEPPLSWVRPAPAFVADLSASGQDRGPTATTLVRHATFRSTMERCAVFGTHHFHAVLQEGGQLSLHYTDPDRMRRQIDHYITHEVPQSPLSPRIEAAEGTCFCTTDHLAAAHTVRVEAPVFFGSPIEPDNFGMWVVTGLAGAHDFVSRGKEQKFLCWSRFDWQGRLLAYMGIRDEQIVVQEPHRLYFCDRLTMRQYTCGDLLLTPSDLALFADLRARCRQAPPNGAEKIFISRRSFTRRVGYRALLNEDELIAALQDRGFLIVEPEMLDFPAQISLFAHARVVIGLGGAAMFNAVFCRPGRKIVCIEGTRAFAHGHANLFASAHLDYAFIFGRQDEDDPAPIHKRWHVDVDQAMRHIDRFI